MKLTKCMGMAAGLWLILVGQPAVAGVNVGIGIGIDLPLPVFTFQAPPELVVVPGSYVYYVPDVDHDIRFYQGYWYRSWNNRWHRARSYNGPWAFIGPRYVPAPVFRLPPDYRRRVIYERVRYDDVNRHWRRWERERYWEKNRDWWRKKHDPRDDRRDDRGGRGDHHDRNSGRGR